MQLYKFYVDCGRMGSLDGLFAATPGEIAGLKGRTVNFGEVLGKHSSVSIVMEASMFRQMPISEDVVVLLIKEIGKGGTISGFSPFDYLEPNDEDEDEE